MRLKIPRGFELCPIQRAVKSGWLTLAQRVVMNSPGVRPVLIVSDDGLNSSSAGIVIGVPLTTKVGKRTAVDTHVPITPPDGGTRAVSAILCEQVRVLSKDRIRSGPLGTVSDATLAAVETALRTAMQL